MTMNNDGREPEPTDHGSDDVEQPNKGTLADFFQRSPLRGIKIERNADLPRQIDLEGGD